VVLLTLKSCGSGPEKTHYPSYIALPIEVHPISAAMQIFFKTLNGATKTLSLESSSSIENVKEMIQLEENIPKEVQTLLFNGICLDSRRNITDYNIETESTIQLMLSLNGGVFDPSLAALAKKFNCEKQVCRK
jgi:hypothetical protein